MCSLHDRTIVVGVLYLGNVHDSFSLGIFQVPHFIVQRDIAKIDGDLSHNVLGIWTRVQYFPQVSLRGSSPRSLPHGPTTYATLETKLHPSDSHKWKIEFSSVLSCSRCLCWYFSVYAHYQIQFFWVQWARIIFFSKTRDGAICGQVVRSIRPWIDTNLSRDNVSLHFVTTHTL